MISDRLTFIEDTEEEGDAASAGRFLKQRFLRGSNRPAEILARHMLWEVCPASLRRDIARSRSIVVIIEPPAPDWHDAIFDAARALIRPADFLARGLVPRTKEKRLVERVLGDAISIGHSFVAICDDPASQLPAELSSVVDYHLKVLPPDKTAISAALRIVFGTKRVRGVPASVGRASSATALVSTIRPRESAARAVRRLIELDRHNLREPDIGLTRGPRLEELDGYGLAKEWGLDLARDLEAFRRGELAWSELNSAALLYGPPGTGKTFFASAVARSCRVPLISTSLGRLFGQKDSYLDSVIKGFDQAFADARGRAPSILFVDELDALPDRASLSQRNRDYWTTVINHVLKLLDESRDGVIVLGATNMVERIDPALLRPGRIDRHFEIGAPDQSALAAIFRYHLGARLPNLDLVHLARLAHGATAAQAEGYVKLATTAARRANRDLLADDLVRQLVRHDLSDRDLTRICTHEAGHALIAMILGRAVEWISAAGKDNKGGLALIEGIGRIPTRASLEEQALVALAGRTAEILILGEASSGARDDLAMAGHCIALIHGSLGLGETLVSRAIEAEASSLLALESFHDLVEAELRILERRCSELLTRNRDVLMAIAERLKGRRVLTGAELVELAGGHTFFRREGQDSR